MGCPIENLVAKIKKLPDIDQRRISALLGAAVADVATRPLHWMYKQNELDDVLGDSVEPEFWPESKCPFFVIPLGLPSFYNDLALVSLSALYENKKDFDISCLFESFNLHFGPGSDYADALARRLANKSKLIVEGPWIHKSLMRFLENYEIDKKENLGDSENKEFDGFCAALPFIAQKAEKECMWTEASKITSILSTHSQTTEMFHSAALLLSRYIMGDSNAMEKMMDTIESSYPDVYELIKEVEEAKSLPFISTLDKFGKCCYLPGTYQCALLVMFKTSSYVDAVRLNITGGGCSSGRANLIGACYGAKDGIDGIPIDWLKKVTNIEKIIEMSIDVLSSE